MANKHSIYSPSSAKYWLNCPLSVHLCSGLPREKSSPAALEGTRYHALMEDFLKNNTLDDIAFRGYENFLVSSGFEKNILSMNLFHAVKDFFNTLGGFDCGKIKIYLEKKLDISSVILGCYGTSDIVAIVGDHLFVVDYKFGRIAVDPSSEQLILYAIGAFNKYGKDKIKQVSTIIIQPKITSRLKVFSMTVDRLKVFEKTFKKAANRISAKKPLPCIGAWCDEYARCRPFCEAYRKKQVETTKIFFENN